jgi:hypothetical protein
MLPDSKRITGPLDGHCRQCIDPGASMRSWPSHRMWPSRSSGFRSGTSPAGSLGWWSVAVKVGATHAVRGAEAVSAPLTGECSARPRREVHAHREARADWAIAAR